MNIFDTHCHLNLDPLYGEWRTHFDEARAHGVQKFFVPGTTLETSESAIALAGQHEDIFAGAAIHPSETELDSDIASLIDQLETIIKTNRATIIGLGETGLDYYWLPENEDRQTLIELQKQLFISQIKLANQFQLPLIIHVRDRQTPATPAENNAYWDTLELVRQHHHSGTPWILHCASGPEQYIEAAVKMGAYVSFAANITYKKADGLRRLFALVPQDKVLVETDAPYLPPQAFRGKICQPWMIAETVKFIDQELNFPPDTLWQNSGRVFNQVL